MIFLVQLFTVVLALCVIGLLLIPLAAIWKIMRANKEPRKLASTPRTKDKQVEANVGVDVGVQATKIPGPESNAKQLSVRRVNWKDEKQFTERQAAENLCKFTGRSSWKLETRKEYDSADITARSPEGTTSEDFQIVRLWDQDDWRELNTKGAVDRCYSDQEAVDLFRKVLRDKGAKKYPSDVRKKLTLLIDANPIARPSDFVAGVENAIGPLARLAGYKAVWVVGTTDALELSPSLRRTAIVS